MKESGKVPVRKKQKLSVKFTLTCILPASVLLIILCIVSVVITKQSIVQNMKNSLIGQSENKTTSLIENIEGPLNGAVLPQKAKIVSEALADDNMDVVMQNLNGIKNIAPIFANVEIALLEQHRTIGIKGNSEFNEDALWYDSEKIASGNAYFTEQAYILDQSLPLLTYVFPFSREKSSVPDSCFVIELDNKAILRTLELNVSVDDKKWMIISSEDKILYHSLGYNENVFKSVEAAIDTYQSNKATNILNGDKLVVQIMRIEKLNNIGVVYVVTVDGILKNSLVNIILVIAFTALSIVILAFFILFMTKKIVNEINDIRGSLKGVATREYSENIEVQTQDEIGELVEDFNKAIDELRYQAEHDGKTDFYNSQSFAEKASKMIESDKERTYAVVRVDIDNFSFINDIFDWEVGDQILKKIANILKAVFDGEYAIHGYLGNDVFVVLFGYTERDEMLTRIMKASESIKECETRIHLVPHFGIADNIPEKADMSVMCDYAGIALKTIKGNLLETFSVYDEKFDEKHNVQKFVESNKQKALENNEFYILLQPKCDIESGNVVGAEALVRWRESETNTIISPGKFIPIFEKNGFIINLDKYVWEETCKVIKNWREKGYRDIPVSVNVSRMHIFNPGFAQGLESLVRKYGIPPEMLEIEITESALIGDEEGELERVMEDLKSRGFKLLMDDFASGYSSLIALQKLPFDVIKIDKALIDDINIPKNQKFVSGTVSFLFDLEKEIVVEGVEHDWQKEILKSTGSRVVQGYCFSRPVSVEEFEKMAFGDYGEEKTAENEQ